jgi:hypothetical protein
LRFEHRLAEPRSTAAGPFRAYSASTLLEIKEVQMTARRVVGGVALALTVISPRIQAQPRAIIVVLDTSGQPRVMFVPRAAVIASPER